MNGGTTKRLIIALALAGAVLPVSTAAGAPVQEPRTGAGSIGIRLLAAPTAASPSKALANSYIVARLAPGARIERRIEISNSTRSSAEILAYPAAASLDQGTFAFAPSETRNELSSWTSVSRRTLTLAAGSKAQETVTIDVPEHASAGEHYAVVWAAVSTPAHSTGGVTLVNRVGVRIYLSIGPGGSPPSDFAVTALTARRAPTGEPLVVATIHNNGKRTLDITGTLTLTDGPAGLHAGPFTAKLAAPLAPGDAQPITLRLDTQLPRGPWDAHLELSSGLLHREASQTIRFPKHLDAAEMPARSADSMISRHRTLLALSLLVLLALVASSKLRTRSRRFRTRKTSPV